MHDYTIRTLERELERLNNRKRENAITLDLSERMLKGELDEDMREETIHVVTQCQDNLFWINEKIDELSEDIKKLKGGGDA